VRHAPSRASPGTASAIRLQGHAQGGRLSQWRHMLAVHALTSQGAGLIPLINRYGLLDGAELSALTSIFLLKDLQGNDAFADTAFSVSEARAMHA